MHSFRTENRAEFARACRHAHRRYSTAICLPRDVALQLRAGVEFSGRLRDRKASRPGPALV